MLKEKIAEAQDVLNELFNEQLLPFKLSAYKIDSIGFNEYIVRFHDSRLRSVDISWSEGESFRAALRIAILEKTKRLTGPLYGQVVAA